MVDYTISVTQRMIRYPIVLSSVTANSLISKQGVYMYKYSSGAGEVYLNTAMAFFGDREV